MKIAHPRNRAVGAIAALAVTSLLATGCGSLVDRAVERGLEAATGTEGVSVDRDTGTVSIESDEGNITFDTDDDGGSQMTMEGGDGTTSFRSAPTTEVPAEIAELNVIPDGFTPAAYHEQTTEEGKSLVVSGVIVGGLSDLLDDIEQRADRLGETERFIMETGDGGGMGNVTVELDDSSSLVISLLGDPEEITLQVMWLNRQ